jgi:hypothetical protein
MTQLVLKNTMLRVIVDVDRGAEITHIQPSTGNNLLFFADWQAPLPASRSQSYGSDVLDWLSEYRGGWQELFPNAGGSGTVLGTPVPFHGEVSRSRWSWNTIVPDLEVILSTPARLPLVLERRMRLEPDRPVLHIEERVTNEAGFPVPYIWGHHPAWGPPLADTGSVIDLPAGTLTADAGLDGPHVDLEPGSTHSWSITQDRRGNRIDLSRVPAGPVQRLCYLSDLREGWYAVRNPAIRIGVGLAWDTAVFPYLWMWQEIAGGSGMPWYGRARITALEPATQFPAHGLEQAVTQGQAHIIQPGEVKETALTLVLFEATDQPVRRVAHNGDILY